MTTRRYRSPFFFSSRRRHTRSYGDWSSDVCSSDLHQPLAGRRAQAPVSADRLPAREVRHSRQGGGGRVRPEPHVAHRSEERRVGKECRSWWWSEHLKKNKMECGCAVSAS